jgi:hypothetical protein
MTDWFVWISPHSSQYCEVSKKLHTKKGFGECLSVIEDAVNSDLENLRKWMATKIFIGYFNPAWRPNYENIIISFSTILVYE